jgi:hypothetical protein
MHSRLGVVATYKVGEAREKSRKLNDGHLDLERWSYPGLQSGPQCEPAPQASDDEMLW